MKRTWTEVGKVYTEGKQDAISRHIDGMEWQEVPCTVGMAPGEGIKEAIKELRIPKVSHIAISLKMAPLGLYGVRGHYKNGMAQVYMVDSGDVLTPICSDFYEGER